MNPRAPSEDTLKAALRLHSTLECFKEQRHTMPAQYILTFLLVAMHEGKTVGEYASMSDVSPSVMSRHVLDLGEMTRSRLPGLGLVFTKPNVNNLREHCVYLTEKGRSLLHKVTRRMEV